MINGPWPGFLMGFFAITLAAPAFSEQLTFKLPVAKDATIDRDSPDKNFGSEPTIQVNSWYYYPSGLFGFDLADIPNGVVIEKAQLFFGANYFIGIEGCPYEISSSEDEWDESTVTFQNRPAVKYLQTQGMYYDGRRNVFDVTEVVKAFQANKKSLTFYLEAACIGMLTINSKENPAGQASYLLLDVKEAEPAAQR